MCVYPAGYSLALPAASPVLPDINPASVSVPSEWGTVEDVFRGSTDKLVIYIQDAHTNYSAQKNIASIIDYLTSSYGISLVASEAAEGAIETDLIRSFPVREAAERALDGYMRRGEIGGPQFASFASKAPFDFVGIDRNKLYRQNLDEFLAVLAIREEGLSFIDSAEMSLTQIKSRLYTKEQRELDEVIQRFEKNLTDFFGFVKSLRTAAEKMKIDFAQYPSIQTLFEITQSVEAGALDEKAASDQFKALSPEALFGDVERLSLALKLNLSSDKENRRLIMLEKYLSLVKHGLSLELNREDAAELAGMSKKLTRDRALAFLEELTEKYHLRNPHFEKMRTVPMDEYVTKMLTFYKTAAAREHEFMTLLKQEMSLRAKDSSVLVTGGFHREGVTEKFRKANISYVIITPKIAEISDHEKYLALMKKSGALLNLPSRNTINVPVPSLSSGDYGRDLFAAMLGHIYDGMTSAELLAFAEESGVVVPAGADDPDTLHSYVKTQLFNLHMRQANALVAGGRIIPESALLPLLLSAARLGGKVGEKQNRLLAAISHIAIPSPMVGAQLFPPSESKGFGSREDLGVGGKSNSDSIKAAPTRRARRIDTIAIFLGGLLSWFLLPWLIDLKDQYFLRQEMRNTPVEQIEYEDFGRFMEGKEGEGAKFLREHPRTTWRPRDINKDQRDLLIAMLRHPDRNFRLWILNEIVGFDVKEAIPEIIKMLDDLDPVDFTEDFLFRSEDYYWRTDSIRDRVVLPIGYHTREGNSVPTARRMVDWALESLGELGAEEAVPVIMEQLAHTWTDPERDIVTRAEAAIALLRLAGDREDVQEAVRAIILSHVEIIKAQAQKIADGRRDSGKDYWIEREQQRLFSELLKYMKDYPDFAFSVARDFLVAVKEHGKIDESEIYGFTIALSEVPDSEQKMLELIRWIIQNTADFKAEEKDKLVSTLLIKDKFGEGVLREAIIQAGFSDIELARGRAYVNALVDVDRRLADEKIRPAAIESYRLLGREGFPLVAAAATASYSPEVEYLLRATRHESGRSVQIRTEALVRFLLKEKGPLLYLGNEQAGYSFANASAPINPLRAAISFFEEMERSEAAGADDIAQMEESLTEAERQATNAYFANQQPLKDTPQAVIKDWVETVVAGFTQDAGDARDLGAIVQRMRWLIIADGHKDYMSTFEFINYPVDSREVNRFRRGQPSGDKLFDTLVQTLEASGISREDMILPAGFGVGRLGTAAAAALAAGLSLSCLAGGCVNVPVPGPDDNTVVVDPAEQAFRDAIAEALRQPYLYAPIASGHTLPVAVHPGSGIGAEHLAAIGRAINAAADMPGGYVVILPDSIELFPSELIVLRAEDVRRHIQDDDQDDPDDDDQMETPEEALQRVVDEAIGDAVPSYPIELGTYNINVYLHPATDAVYDQIYDQLYAITVGANAVGLPRVEAVKNVILIPHGVYSDLFDVLVREEEGTIIFQLDTEGNIVTSGGLSTEGSTVEAIYKVLGGVSARERFLDAVNLVSFIDSQFVAVPGLGPAFYYAHPDAGSFGIEDLVAYLSVPGRWNGEQIAIVPNNIETFFPLDGLELPPEGLIVVRPSDLKSDDNNDGGDVGEEEFIEAFTLAINQPPLTIIVEGDIGAYAYLHPDSGIGESDRRAIELAVEARGRYSGATVVILPDSYAIHSTYQGAIVLSTSEVLGGDDPDDGDIEDLFNQAVTEAINQPPIPVIIENDLRTYAYAHPESGIVANDFAAITRAVEARGLYRGQTIVILPDYLAIHRTIDGAYIILSTSEVRNAEHVTPIEQLEVLDRQISFNLFNPAIFGGLDFFIDGERSMARTNPDGSIRVSPGSWTGRSVSMAVEGRNYVILAVQNTGSSPIGVNDFRLELVGLHPEGVKLKPASAVPADGNIYYLVLDISDLSPSDALKYVAVSDVNRPVVFWRLTGVIADPSLYLNPANMIPLTPAGFGADASLDSLPTLTSFETIAEEMTKPFEATRPFPGSLVLNVLRGHVERKGTKKNARFEPLYTPVATIAPQLLALLAKPLAAGVLIDEIKFDPLDLTKRWLGPAKQDSYRRALRDLIEQMPLLLQRHYRDNPEFRTYLNKSSARGIKIRRAQDFSISLDNPLFSRVKVYRNDRRGRRAVMITIEFEGDPLPAGFGAEGSQRDGFSAALQRLRQQAWGLTPNGDQTFVDLAREAVRAGSPSAARVYARQISNSELRAQALAGIPQSSAPQTQTGFGSEVKSNGQSPARSLKREVLGGISDRQPELVAQEKEKLIDAMRGEFGDNGNNITTLFVTSIDSLKSLVALVQTDEFRSLTSNVKEIIPLRAAPDKAYLDEIDAIISGVFPKKPTLVRSGITNKLRKIQGDKSVMLVRDWVALTEEEARMLDFVPERFRVNISLQSALSNYLTLASQTMKAILASA